MFGLDTSLTILLIACLLAACIFEFINGFHDTANAVATVIYTNSLKPYYAVVWSGIWNAIGVFAGGIAVAMGISNLLPVEILTDTNIYHNIALIISLLLTAIMWNLGTWYFGIPCSSSHTLIGSILGVGVTYSLIAEKPGNYVNWSKAGEIGMSLLISPIFGFSLAILFMYILRQVIKKKTIFKEPEGNNPPPFWIRLILLLTCTSVSFSHGSNDGQKGVGLVMLILIAIVPTYFTIDSGRDPMDFRKNMVSIDLVLNKVNTSNIETADSFELAKVKHYLTDLHIHLDSVVDFNVVPVNSKYLIRKDLITLGKATKKLLDSETLNMSVADKKVLKAEVTSLKSLTDYAPFWVILMISISLGLGTMIGWKRIVITIGEKIGKQHLSYAQGASSELVAAGTIGVSTYLGLPVSTTQVLSSGIAGSMVATKGVKNLQGGTIKNIAIAWILTLPVCIVVAGLLYYVLRLVL
ncbi:MAG: inorganic phosphate transporter [Bacteroidetes bacterium]|nr:inorganic phosphate transporter [Bacteroidota bacterium]